MLARQLLAVLPLLLALAHGQEAAPAATATAAKKTSSSSSHHTGPFSAFTKSLPQEKKKPFMELMKRLRSAKAATVGTKDEKKKVMGALDSDIHKLLGNEYKRYRTTQHAQKELHTSLKKGTTATASATPPPAPAPVAAAAPASKKSSKLPGTKSKKKASTTVG